LLFVRDAAAPTGGTRNSQGLVRTTQQARHYPGPRRPEGTPVAGHVACRDFLHACAHRCSLLLCSYRAPIVLLSSKVHRAQAHLPTGSPSVGLPGMKMQAEVATALHG
jgi:hypothetical protein